MTTFSALCRAFLSEEREAAPVMASGLGLTEFDDRLDDLSEAAIRERQRRSAAWRVRFRAVPDTGLTPDERIDRDFIVSILLVGSSRSGSVTSREARRAARRPSATSTTGSRAAAGFPPRWRNGRSSQARSRQARAPATRASGRVH